MIIIITTIIIIYNSINYNNNEGFICYDNNTCSNICQFSKRKVNKKISKNNYDNDYYGNNTSKIIMVMQIQK